MTDPANVRYRKVRGSRARVCKRCHADLAIKNRKNWPEDKRAARIAADSESRRRRKGYSGAAPPEVWPRGETHPLATLTDAKVREIRAMRAAGIMPKETAARLGVGVGAVDAVIRGVTWRHVT